MSTNNNTAPTLSERFYNLESRTSILETKFSYLHDAIDDNQAALKRVEATCHEVDKHLARQNGSIPRMEKNIRELMIQVNKQEKASVSIGIKTKLLWSLFASLLTGVVLVGLKILLGV